MILITSLVLSIFNGWYAKVPEEMQLNVSKKQREMVLLEESLYNMRCRFNRRFLALRGIKREILATVAKDSKRLKEIDTELGCGEGRGEAGGERVSMSEHWTILECLESTLF